MEHIITGEAQTIESEAVITSEASIESEAVITSDTVMPINEIMQFNSLIQDLNNFKTLISDMQAKVRLLEKTVAKNQRDKEKEVEKDKKKNVVVKIQKQSSGFDIPVAISDEMCAFMNKSPGTLVTRTAVAEYMIHYIRINKLQDMTNRKKINPNDTVTKLLRLNNEELTYFNLQKYLNQHFNGSVSR